MEEVVDLVTKVDEIFKQVINGKKDVFNDIDEVLIASLKIEDMEDEVAKLGLCTISTKLDLINKLLEIDYSRSSSLEVMREDFEKLELEKFNIESKYVMGILSLDEIESFKINLFGFKDRLYAIPINDNNLLEIAKFKSKIQHFDTDILEDEDILRQAYQNSN
jgi:hypothetical protein